MERKFFTVRNIVLLAILTATEIVLSRFLSVSLWNFKFGFAFVPVVIAAAYFGPLGAGFLAALADLVGALLFPIGPYFPGFTVTQFLVGLTYGLFLHKHRDMKHIVPAVLITQFIFSMLLSGFWISILYGTPLPALLPVRFAEAAAECVVQLVLLPLLLAALPRILPAHQ